MEGPGFAVALDAADVICIAVAAASSSTSSATAYNEQVSQIKFWELNTADILDSETGKREGQNRFGLVVSLPP